MTIISHLDTEPLPLLFPMGAGQTQGGAGESKDSQKFAAECVSLNKNNNSKMEKTIIIVQAELQGEGKGALDTERQNLGGKGRARA